MLRLPFRFICLMLIAISFMFGANANPANAAKTYNIQLAGSVPEDHPATLALYKIRDLADKYSNGQLKIKVFPNSQLGSNREFYEQLQAGNLQMAEAGAVILANFTNKFKFTQIPFLFNSRESMQNFLYSPLGEQMKLDIAKETGIYPLVFFENGWQCLTNSKRAVKTPEDLKGMKIRTQENDVLLQIYKAMGANPTPMAWTEVFTALQQKTVDGQVNPALLTQTNKFFEVQKYTTDINAVYDVIAISVNYDFFNELPKELQDVIKKATKEACEYQLTLMANSEEESYKFVASKGMEVTRLTPEERAVFRKTTDSVVEWFTGLNIEPNLPKYLEAIKLTNDKFIQGKLVPHIGYDK